jgi:hypothetical protein
MGRIVNLILSHKVEPTQYLVDLFNDRFVSLIHFDSRVDLDRASFRLPSNAHLTDHRYRVFWGGFNMIHATRDLIATARRLVPDAERYVLISGDSLPVVGLNRLAERMLDPKEEHIDLTPVANDPRLQNVTHEEAQKLHSWLQPWNFQNYVFWDHMLSGPRTEAEVIAELGIGTEAARRLRAQSHFMTQDILRKLPPRQQIFRRYYFGAQWWAITRACMDRIFDRMFDPAVEKFFEFMPVPDETFFHCLIGEQISALEGDGHKFLSTMMYTDHTDPVRASFGDDALSEDKIVNAHQRFGKLFARKFSPARTPALSAALNEGAYLSQLPQ